MKVIKIYNALYDIEQKYKQEILTNGGNNDKLKSVFGISDDTMKKIRVRYINSGYLSLMKKIFSKSSPSESVSFGFKSYHIIVIPISYDELSKFKFKKEYDFANLQSIYSWNANEIYNIFRIYRKINNMQITLRNGYICFDDSLKIDCSDNFNLYRIVHRLLFLKVSWSSSELLDFLTQELYQRVLHTIPNPQPQDKGKVTITNEAFSNEENIDEKFHLTTKPSGLTLLLEDLWQGILITDKDNNTWFLRGTDQIDHITKIN